MIRVTFEFDNEEDAEQVLELGRSLTVRGLGNVHMRAERQVTTWENIENAGSFVGQIEHPADADDPIEIADPRDVVDLSPEAREVLASIAHRKAQERELARLAVIPTEQEKLRLEREDLDRRAASYKHPNPAKETP